jgi:EAL domain-containing protein (putative c-di-GMP-specific phosphodiesterase class I)/GGDEF domain-containing protein/PAS domain-containing protein
MDTRRRNPGPAGGLDLAETGAIPVVVLSRQQDPVEIINSTLRNAGHPVHCLWVRDLSTLGDTLAQSSPQLIFLCTSDPDETAAALEARQRNATQVPALLVRDSLTEDDLAEAVGLGAQDVVTLRSRPRLQAVAGRELHASRLDRALAGTLASARQYRDQMKAFMTGSTDAIAHVEEGIVVDVNPAWVELFGHEEPAAFLGQPLMDFFQQRSHAALRGALVATAQGRWSNHSLQAVALMPAGTELPVQIEFERIEFEGEPAVRMRVPTQTRDLETLTRQLEEALLFDTTTGLMKRAAFVEQANAHAAQPLKAGLRAVVYIEPDRLAAVENELGPLAAEDLLEGIGQQLRALLQPGDLAARVTARGFALLVERGNTRDLDAWVARALQRLAEHVFSSGDRALSFTCSAGATLLSAHGEGIATALLSSVKAARNAAAAGGNRLRRPEPSAGKPEIEAADQAWAARIKSALMANRFRLVHQPIASLVGEGEPMFDLVVRMLDERNEEVLPSEFLAAAQRTDLMKNIDRWVVGAAMSFCAERGNARVFVRLSTDSMRDKTLGAWLQQQIKASGVDPQRVVFELHEETAATHLEEIRALQALVRPLGFPFALENFGSSKEPDRLLGQLSASYVKIDGALMQGLATDRSLQEQVKTLVQLARARGITTIAERVEDANTMAVLWQLGVEFVQGYFVGSAEEVVLHETR